MILKNPEYSKNKIKKIPDFSKIWKFNNQTLSSAQNQFCKVLVSQFRVVVTSQLQALRHLKLLNRAHVHSANMDVGAFFKSKCRFSQMHYFPFWSCRVSIPWGYLIFLSYNILSYLIFSVIKHAVFEKTKILEDWARGLRITVSSESSIFTLFLFIYV